MVTLPALFLATYLVGIAVGDADRRACSVRVGGARRALRQHPRRGSRSCGASSASRCRCSCSPAPSTSIAGLTIEKRFESFLVYPALLVLVPPFLEDSGALGGILSARVSTKLHLGTLVPGPVEPARGRRGLPPGVHLRGSRVPPARGVGRHRRRGRGAEEPGQPGDDRGVDARGVARDHVRGARRVLRRGRRRTGSGSIPTTTGSRSSRRASTSSARSR